MSMMWQGDLAAALAWPHPSPLLDEVHVCLLRLLALDEPRSERSRRSLDLALLDAVTWPPYVWEYLRLRGDPLAALGASLRRDSAAGPAITTRKPNPELDSNTSAMAMGARDLLRRPVFRAPPLGEYNSLPAAAKAAVLAALAGYVLDVSCVRAEIERREAGGEWVTGVGGVPGRWAMRSAAQRAARDVDPAAQACLSIEKLVK